MRNPIAWSLFLVDCVLVVLSVFTIGGIRPAAIVLASTTMTLALVLAVFTARHVVGEVFTAVALLDRAHRLALEMFFPLDIESRDSADLLRTAAHNACARGDAGWAAAASCLADLVEHLGHPVDADFLAARASAKDLQWLIEHLQVEEAKATTSSDVDDTMGVLS